MSETVTGGRDTVAIQCARCERAVQARPTTTGEPRLPRAWKRHAGAVWCDRCWRTHWMLRAVTIPVARPLGAEWKDLQRALDASWRAATTVANVAVQELLRADVTRTPDMEKLPPMPRTYLYPRAREVAPELDTSSVVALLQAVERRYRARRYHVVWLRAEAPPSYRYPTPIPVHNQRWSAEIGTDGEERGRGIVSVRLGGERWRLLLRGGAGHTRALAAVRKLAHGEALQGELALYRRGHDVLAKMVMWLPRETKARAKEGTLYVRTGGGSLWTYHVDDGEPRYLHADDMRRWVANYDRRRQRLADDTKAEKRPTKRRGRGIAETREAWARKQKARLDSKCHEMTAMLVKYAERQGVATVVYDDRDKSYMAHAPWHLLRERLAYKLDAAGIALEIASDDVADESASPLDGEA